MDLPPEDAIRLINKAIEKEAENKVWQMYLIKSIFAGKEYPDFNEIIKKAHEKSHLQDMNWDKAEKLADEAYEAFKRKKVK